MSLGVVDPSSPRPQEAQGRSLDDPSAGALLTHGLAPKSLTETLGREVASSLESASGRAPGTDGVVECAGEAETAGQGPLSPAEVEAWFALSAIMLKLPGLLDQQLQRESDLTFFEYVVLAALAERTPPRLRMSQLSILTSGSLSRLSHVAKRLELKGYIVRKPDSLDRRSTNAILTPAGLVKVRETAPGHIAWVRHLVFDNLTQDQVHELTQIGAAVRPRIDPENELRPL